MHIIVNLDSVVCVLACVFVRRYGMMMLLLLLLHDWACPVRACVCVCVCVCA